MNPRPWLLLQYKLPSRPSARRVYAWRKLQRLGAIFWQDAAWVLPDTSRTREQFQWLSAEIVEMKGEATLWVAHLMLPEQEELLLEQFTAQSETAYQDILTTLKKKRPNLVHLSRQFQQALAQDYFNAPSGPVVRAALLAARGDDS